MLQNAQAIMRLRNTITIVIKSQNKIEEYLEI